jgi:hypothetical protein
MGAIQVERPCKSSWGMTPGKVREAVLRRETVISDPAATQRADGAVGLRFFAKQRTPCFAIYEASLDVALHLQK